jgi:hypothetical protein
VKIFWGGRQETEVGSMKTEEKEMEEWKDVRVE